MGPHSFERGDVGIRSAAGRVGSLQWGRTLSSAEMPKDKLELVEGAALQWGRTLSSAEIFFTLRLKPSV